MIRGIFLTGLLILLCQEMHVMTHVLSRPNSANTIAKLKGFLQQFEEALASEEPADKAVDYEDATLSTEQGQPEMAWQSDSEAQNTAREDGTPRGGYEAQRNRLMDLLTATRSKTFSGCFGGRLDRIGSSSGLGCNSKRG
ncbi:natriuretic peptides A [Chanos chanos]|uniref:Natriuretic peptides A n=1 Tax=Chanos chanos TaxID=29144 RepID=A0A6J2W8J8_CHACN|nr:natriuretic peptides A-like [Chanos chanos]